MSKLFTHRAVIIVLFTLLFISIGWATPVLYAMYAPQAQFVQVTKFSPQNATVNSQYHSVCWQTKVNKPAAADVNMELILVNDGSNHEVYHTTFDQYFDNDHRVHSFRQKLPTKLKTGKYRYKAVAQLHLANGRVKRTVAWTSDPFYVKGPNATIVNATC